MGRNRAPSRLHRARMNAYTWAMSTTRTARPSTARPTGTYPTSPTSSTPFSQDACPTEALPIVPAVAPVPVRRSILHPAASPSPSPSPFAGWRDRAQTEPLPAVPAGAGSTVSPLPSGQPSPARPRVSTHRKPTSGLGASRTPSRRPSPGTKGLRRPRPVRHLRAALTALALAAAILIPMQLFAAHGISSARQAALEQARTPAASAVPMPGQSTHSEQGATSPMSGQSDPQPEWVTEQTHAPFDRTNPAASPLDLPRCTTSPDTPLPCLATISPDSRRAVVLEEDASLTALTRR